MTLSVQDPEGLAKHFSDIHRLTDVLVWRTAHSTTKCMFLKYIFRLEKDL